MKTLCKLVLLFLWLGISEQILAQRIGGVPDPQYNPQDVGSNYNFEIYKYKAMFWPEKNGGLNGYQELTWNEPWDRRVIRSYNNNRGYRDRASSTEGEITKTYVQINENEQYRLTLQGVASTTSPVATHFQRSNASGDSDYWYYSGSNGINGTAVLADSLAVGDYSVGGEKYGQDSYYFWITSRDFKPKLFHNTTNIMRNTFILGITNTVIPNYCARNSDIKGDSLVLLGDSLINDVPLMYPQIWIFGPNVMGKRVLTVSGIKIKGKIEIFEWLNDGKCLVGGLIDIGGGTVNALVRINANGSLDNSFTPFIVPVLDAVWFPSDNQTFKLAWLETTGSTRTIQMRDFNTNGQIIRQNQRVLNVGWPVEKVLMYHPFHDAFLIQTLPFCNEDSVIFPNQYAQTCYRFYVNYLGQHKEVVDNPGILKDFGHDSFLNTTSNERLKKVMVTGKFTMVNNRLSPGLAVINADGSLDTTWKGFLSFPDSLRKKYLLNPAFHTHHLVGGKKILSKTKTGNTSDLFKRYLSNGQLDATYPEVRSIVNLITFRNGDFGAVSYFDVATNQPVQYYTKKRTAIRFTRLDTSGNPKGNPRVFIPDPNLEMNDTVFRSRGFLAEDNQGGVWFGVRSTKANTIEIIGKNLAGAASYMVCFKNNGSIKVIIPDSAVLVNAQKVQIINSNRIRLVGGFNFGKFYNLTYSSNLYMEDAIDSNGVCIRFPGSGLPKKWTLPDAFTERGNIALVYQRELPDGKFLFAYMNQKPLSHTIWHFIRFTSDGRFDPSFIPVRTQIGSWLDHHVFNDKLFFRTDFYTWQTQPWEAKSPKNGMAAVQLRSLPGTTTFVQGRVTKVTSPNAGCTSVGTKIPVNFRLIKASPGGQLAMTDTGGFYNLMVTPGNREIGQVLGATALQRQVCPVPPMFTRSVSLPAVGQTSIQNDFINQTYLCPRLYMEMSQPRFQWCTNETITIRYKNDGTATEPNARILLNLPRGVWVKSANKPFARLGDSTLVFTLGSLAINESGSLLIQDSVACLNPAPSLQMACFSARMEPMGICSQVTPSQIGWDGSWLDAKAHFLAAESKVRLVIYAKGSPMQDSVDHTAYGTGFYVNKKIKLAPNDSLVYMIPTGPGSGIGLNLTMPANCPLAGTGQLFHSGNSETPTYLSYQEGWLESQSATGCTYFEANNEPFNKEVFPNVPVEPGTEISYRIRFENQGSDTAMAVAVVDSLPEGLDASSFRLTNSSHPCQILIEGTEEKPIFNFVFNPITLAARKQDSVTCRGQIEFKIKTKTTIARGTNLNSRAHIFFDGNPPISTNAPTTKIRLLETETEVDGPTGRKNALVHVWPNPTAGTFLVSLPPGFSRSEIQVSDLQGKKMSPTKGKQGNLIEISGLPPGMYVLKADHLAPVRVVVVQ